MQLVNFVPAYQQAPVSLHLLKEHLDDAVRRAGEEDVRLLLPADFTWIARFGAAGIALDPAQGFLAMNNSAVEVALEGYQPVPTGPAGSRSLPLVSGERWLLGEGDTKRLWFEGADAPVELPCRTTGRELVEAAGISMDETQVKAIYLGFPQSVFIPADRLDEPLDLSCDYARVYVTGDCMAQALHQIARRFHGEDCGHCVFGYEGGHQIDAILSDIVGKKGTTSDIVLLRDLCPVMSEQSLCGVGQVLARTVLQALDLFGDEIEAHVTKRQCPAGECRAFMTYHILVSRCTGCGACLDACEDDAIMGKAGFVHVIDQHTCTQCGLCLKACPKDAVVMAGTKKPKTPPRPIPCKVH